MLPKFRPAQVGNTLARPSIRPVKAAGSSLRPPPPPTPPRRRPSGITSKNDRAAGFRGEEIPALYLEEDDEEDVATRVGNFRDLDDEPQTEAAVTRPRIGSPETVRYDDETKALPVDERLLQHARSAAPADPYAALPSLEVQRVDDHIEREFAERYPYDGNDSPTNRNVEYAVSSDDFLESEPKPEHAPDPQVMEPMPMTARGVAPDPGGSGARPRVDTAIFDDDGPSGGGDPRGQEMWQMESSVIVNQGSHASQPPQPMFPSIPPPAPVPRDAFIVGVQPIRSGYTPADSMAPMAQPMSPTAPPPAYPQPMPTAAASPRAMHQQTQMHQQMQMQMQAPAPVFYTGAHPRVVAQQQATQPARPQAQQGSFRFLWFVVGAVFGIAAFFGASSAAYKYSQPAFPPAAPLPKATATATTTAAPTAPPAAVTAPPPATTADAKPTDAKPADVKPADPKPADAKTETKTASTPATPPAPAVTAKKPVAPAPAPPPRTTGKAPRQMYTGSSPTSGGDEGGGGGAASFGGGGGGSSSKSAPPSVGGDVFGAALAD